jgi:beta-glucosidase
LDWSRLQRAPYADFDEDTVKEYTEWLTALKSRNLHVMLVLHHFGDPTWFAEKGAWLDDKSFDIFLDFAKKMIHHFARFADSWNTFNEPGGYMMMGWLLRTFPPWKKSWFKVNKVLKNMAKTHEATYDLIKAHSDKPVGISKHTMLYERENIFGIIAERFIDWFYMTKIPDAFHKKADFFGLSYYGRVPLAPLPISEIDTPGKLEKSGKKHDKMWEYHPQGIEKIIKRYYKRYGLPIWITENGLCTDDDDFRTESIRDYLQSIHKCIEDGVPVKAYFHWTTWDNFEWFLGPQFRFGLYHTDFKTMERTAKGSAKFFREIQKRNSLRI